MKVTLKELLGNKDNLSMNKNYIVYSVEISQSGEKFYRIQNDAYQIVPYPSTLFHIASDKINKDWILWQKPNNCSALLPKQFAYLSFWENFYNDDDEALNVFNLVKEQLYQEELDDDEINQILQTGNEEEVSTVFKILTKTKNNRFINQAIQYSKSSLEKNVGYDDTVLSAFRYLSLFKQNEVDEFFIHYLTNIEFGSTELTSIVNSYFGVE